LFVVKPESDDQGALNARRRDIVRRCFEKFDRTGDGVVTAEDLRGVYSARRHPDVMAGKRSEEEVLREFLETFEVGGSKDGVVTLSEFENYYANVSASIDGDDYFELVLTNAWSGAVNAKPAQRVDVGKGSAVVATGGGGELGKALQPLAAAMKRKGGSIFKLLAALRDADPNFEGFCDRTAFASALVALRTGVDEKVGGGTQRGVAEGSRRCSTSRRWRPTGATRSRTWT
jgi:hypothetical protein